MEISFFNVNDGYLEGICRGLRSAFLTEEDYKKLSAADTLEGTWPWGSRSGRVSLCMQTPGSHIGTSGDLAYRILAPARLCFSAAFTFSGCHEAQRLACSGLSFVSSFLLAPSRALCSHTAAEGARPDDGAYPQRLYSSALRYLYSLPPPSPAMREDSYCIQGRRTTKKSLSSSCEDVLLCLCVSMF